MMMSDGKGKAEGARTLAAIRQWAVGELKRAGVETAELDARLLICHALQIDDLAWFAVPSRPLAPAKVEQARYLVRRRLAGEPVSRITGRRGFWKHDFLVTPHVLDPRPDSESLIEAALKLAGQSGEKIKKIVDLGCGSGALLLSLLSEFPAAHGLGVDISEKALGTARENARLLGLEGRADFACGNWLEGVTEKFDLIISNPPYIRSGDIGGLAREVRDHDPCLALDGGADGLDAYRAIIPGLRENLRPGAHALFEIGAGQEKEVTAMLGKAGLDPLGWFNDLSSRPRVVAARAPRS